MVTPPLPGKLVPMFDHSFSKEIFPYIQSQPPLMQLEPISSHPIVSYLGEETNTCLTTTSFQVLVESVVEYVDHGDVGDKEKVNNSLFLDSLSPITKY